MTGDRPTTGGSPRSDGAAGGPPSAGEPAGGDSTATPGTNVTDRPAPGPDATDRPTPASWGARVAAVVGGAAVLGLGAAAGIPGVAGVATASAAALAVAVVLVTGEDPLRVGAGTALGLAAMAGVVVAAASGPAALSLALSAAAFGAASTPLGAVGEGRFVRGLGMFTYALVPLGTVAVASALWPVVGVLGVATVVVVRGGGGPTDLLTGAVLGSLAAASLRSAVRAVPAAELAPRGERGQVRTAVGAAESALTVGLRCALAGVAAGLALLVVAGLGTVPDPLLDALAATAGAAPLRWTLLAAAVAGVVVSVSVRTVRWTGATLAERARRGAAVGAGLGLTLVLAAGATPLLAAAGRRGPAWLGRLLADVATVFGTVQAALLATSVLLLSAVFGAVVLPAAVGLGIAPDRALGPALAAAGLIAAGVLAAGTAGPVAVFGAVAAGMVAWDVGEYAVGVGEEVGSPDARTPEAVHAAGSLGTGLVAVVVAWGLQSSVAGAAAGGPLALVGLAAAFVGVVVLVALLRG